jgi:hypothetical protein
MVPARPTFHEHDKVIDFRTLIMTRRFSDAITKAKVDLHPTPRPDLPVLTV